jgi:hypothetical protein
MIILVPEPKFYKKRKKIYTYRDFTIVNTTGLPRMRDQPNVLADIETTDNGLRSLSNFGALAYQMDTVIFDETLPERRRENTLRLFFGSDKFMTETMCIVAYQLKHPDQNVYVVLDGPAYDRYIDRYMETINNIIDEPDFDNKIFFTWNSALRMKDYLYNQISKELGSFDEEKWLHDKESSLFSDTFIDLEDDDYDIYLDNKNIIDLLEDPNLTNKEIRELFMRYAKYPKKTIKAMARFVKKTTDTAEDKSAPAIKDKKKGKE